MGGIHTGMHGATPLPGLYAAGEAACVSINGANRLGSNSLTECLVFGARAGKAAAHFASDQLVLSAGEGNDPSSSIALVADEERLIEKQLFGDGKRSERIATLRSEMHKAMEEGAGIYRNEASLRTSQETIRKLQERFSRISLADQSYTFNTELIAALELSYMLDVAETIIQSALKRTESRGSHQRTDYPKRDDKNFLTHSLANRVENGSPRIEYLPVTITRWQPGERVYGK